jgi:hypothetical protein
MRASSWLGGMVFLFVLIAPAVAQNADPTSFMTGISPRDLVNKKIDLPNGVLGPSPAPDKFSFKQILSKLVPGLGLTREVSNLSANALASSKPPNLTQLSPSVVSGAKGKKSPQSFPISLPNVIPTDGKKPLIYPLPPTTTLPTIPDSPFKPVLPTTTLPPPVNTTIKPVLPFTPKN